MQKYLDALYNYLYMIYAIKYFFNIFILQELFRKGGFVQGFFSPGFFVWRGGGGVR